MNHGFVPMWTRPSMTQFILLMPAFDPSDPSRDRVVQSMFDRIAGRYDLLNRIISFRLDSWWRKQAIKIVLTSSSQLILDLGAGTGDLTFAAAKTSRGRAHIVGLDFSPQMLRIAQEKKNRLGRAGNTSFVLGSALAVPFKDSVFDAAMTAFVLRNVSDLSLFFAQAFRVLKPGGTFVSLDMFPPSNGCFSILYGLYFYHLVPWIGGLMAHDSTAYRYLSESVRRFHSPETIANAIERAGFTRVKVRRFLSGAVCMHVGEKLLQPALDA